MRAAARKAWFVAASIGAVEALKDQVGICRWNFIIRSVHQHAKNNLRSSLNQANKAISSSPASREIYNSNNFYNKAKKPEEKVKRVMDLSCWGPRKAWIVALSVGALEAFKDQAGICRWNNSIRSFAQVNLIYAPASDFKDMINFSSVFRNKNSMEKIMLLGCWGPNTVRF
ncbi:hypothetical protein WN944_001740 [Citrus x changshan-huyou]|uniref:Wound-responsive family protein n=1 Tax=Citrus x changshan-huyou TaxID=2935761 RepID=A0AAP0MHP9_9ROSI